MMNPPRYFLRNAPALVYTHVQSFDEVGNVFSELNSTKLVIPYRCIFDDVSGNPPDVEFSLQELRRFALYRFAMLV